MTTRLLPFLAMLLVGGMLGYAAGGVFRSEAPAEAPVLEAWKGPVGFSVESSELSLAEIRAREGDDGNDDEAASGPKSGARRATPLTLPQAMEAMRSLDDAQPGEATNRRERDLVERWAELDPAARNRTIVDVVRTWRRADTPAANAFVQASAVLPPELKQRLLR